MASNLKILSDNSSVVKILLKIMDESGSVKISQYQNCSLSSHPGTLNFKIRLNEAQRINRLNMKMAIRLENVKSIYERKRNGYHVTTKIRRNISSNRDKFPSLPCRNKTRNIVRPIPSDAVSLISALGGIHKSGYSNKSKSKDHNGSSYGKGKSNEKKNLYSSRKDDVTSHQFQYIGCRKSVVKKKNEVKIENESGKIHVARVNANQAPTLFDSVHLKSGDIGNSTYSEGDRSVTDYFDFFDDHTEFASSNEFYGNDDETYSKLSTDYDTLRTNRKSNTNENVPNDNNDESHHSSIYEGSYYSDFESDLVETAIACDDTDSRPTEYSIQIRESSGENESNIMKSEIELIRRSWRRQLVVNTGHDSPPAMILQKKKSTPHPRTMGASKTIPITLSIRYQQPELSRPDHEELVALSSCTGNNDGANKRTPQPPVRTHLQSFQRRNQQPQERVQLKTQFSIPRGQPQSQIRRERFTSDKPMGGPLKPMVAMSQLTAPTRYAPRPPPRQSAPVPVPFRYRTRIVAIADSKCSANGAEVFTDMSKNVSNITASDALVTTISNNESASSVAVIATAISAAVDIHDPVSTIDPNMVGEGPHGDECGSDEYSSDEQDDSNEEEQSREGKGNEERNIDEDEEKYEDDYDEDSIGPECLSPPTPDGNTQGGDKSENLPDPLCVPLPLSAPASVMYDSDTETVRRYHPPIQPAAPNRGNPSRPHVKKRNQVLTGGMATLFQMKVV